MKKIFSSFLVASLLTSLSAQAETVQTLNGRGIDGQPCSVKIVREGNVLKSVALTGAAKVFEILAESGGSTGPRSSIDPRGAEEIFSIAEDGNSDVLSSFSHSENFFSNGEVFKLDTNDLPSNGEEELKGLKMIIQMDLDYDGQELVSVKASNKAKALLIATLASSQFTCEK